MVVSGLEGEFARCVYGGGCDFSDHFRRVYEFGDIGPLCVALSTGRVQPVESSGV